MPYTFDFDSTNGILRCRLNGRVTDGEFKDFIRTGAECAVRTQPSSGVVDLSEVASFEVSAQTILELAKLTPAVHDSNLRRIVIAPSPDIYGMMRMFEMEGEQTRPDLQVVRTQREAWAILAVQDPRFEPVEIK